MKLKEGMYVRTKYGIFQITNDKTFIENKIEYIGVNGRYTSIDVNTVIKASNNIIDLIEVGDYVNGYKVYYCYCADEDMTGLFIDTETKRVWLDKSSQIKSIVTKEQFESIKYSLEG